MRRRADGDGKCARSTVFVTELLRATVLRNEHRRPLVLMLARPLSLGLTIERRAPRHDRNI